MGDGDGWADCELGHRHWGRYGAAGLLLYHLDPEPYVLLQHRALLSIGGGTWGLLGGARHSHEDAVAGALREASEESTLDPSVVRVHGLIGEHHGGWSYETVIGSVAERPDVRGASFETSAVRWVHVDEVADMKLFTPFADMWPRLRRALIRPVLVIDAAAVLDAGSGGGWLDGGAAGGDGRGDVVAGGRSPDLGAAVARLRDRLTALGPVGGLPGAVTDVAYPEVVLVVGEAARDVASVDGVRVVAVSGDGGAAAPHLSAARDEHRVVVTADPRLRDRAASAGVPAVAPRWLFDCLR